MISYYGQIGIWKNIDMLTCYVILLHINLLLFSILQGVTLTIVHQPFLSNNTWCFVYFVHP